MVEVSLSLKISDIMSKIAKPKPWIDSNSLREFGNALHNHINELANKTQIMQEDGWSFKMEYTSICAHNDKITTKKEAKKYLASIGINPDDKSLVTMWNKNYTYAYDY